MKNPIAILMIVARLFLGGMLVYGGFGKFSKPSPTPVEVVEKAGKFTAPEKTETLQKVLYINGMKQTGFAWELLGFCEIAFGLLLILQFTGLIGAILSLPITVHIFLFHLFLEMDELGELGMTAALLAINILLVAREFPKWKHLVWIRPLSNRT